MRFTVKFKLIYRFEFYKFTNGNYRFNLYDKKGYLHFCKKSDESWWINHRRKLNGEYIPKVKK